MAHPLALLGALVVSVLLIAGAVSVTRYLLEPKKAKRK